MPLMVEQKCCCKENLNNTHLPEYVLGTCVLACEEIQHVVGKVNVRCAWLNQQRSFGLTGPALAFANMSNKAYRYHAYRCYINYIHGLLGRYNRKVAPACVVNHIRKERPDHSDQYKGFVDVDENGTERPMDELVELPGDQQTSKK